MKRIFTHIIFTLLLTTSVVHHAYAKPSDAKEEKPVSLFSVTPAQNMQLVKVGKITKLVGEDRFELDDGLIYILSNIRVPLKLQEPVKKYFKEKLIGQSVGIFIPEGLTTDDVSDTFGQVTAHIMTRKGLWVQADITSKGLAYVDSTRKNRDMVQALYLYENAARESNYGIWAYKDYDVKKSDTIGDHLNSFQVYEGRVSEVSRLKEKNTAYTIHFTPNEKDLKLSINLREIVPLNKPWAKNYNIFSLEGRKIRVRGWVEDSKGPLIPIDHFEQIEVLAN